jgi:hypothetical protein
MTRGKPAQSIEIHPFHAQELPLGETAERLGVTPRQASSAEPAETATSAAPISAGTLAALRAHRTMNIRKLEGANPRDRKKSQAKIAASDEKIAAAEAIIRAARLGSHDENEVIEAFETTFGLERDLQNALRAQIEHLESGLTVIDAGKERSVSSGRIDITARDRNGITVIIELNAGDADRNAIGQILAYMGDILTEEKSVRGIIIARDFTASAIAAARAAPKVELRRYRITFSFPSVHPT